MSSNKHLCNSCAKRQRCDFDDFEFDDNLNVTKCMEYLDDGNIISKIKQWGIDRGLDTQDPHIQMCKAVEELGELAKAINKNDSSAQIDGIGDTVVTLIMISMQLGHDFKECLNVAYNEIKDRKGKLIHGTLVKDEDIR